MTLTETTMGTRQAIVNEVFDDTSVAQLNAALVPTHSIEQAEADALNTALGSSYTLSEWQAAIATVFPSPPTMQWRTVSMSVYNNIIEIADKHQQAQYRSETTFNTLLNAYVVTLQQFGVGSAQATIAGQTLITHHASCPHLELPTELQTP